MVQFLQPTNVLEIGTHIGASTLHIAAALHEQLPDLGSRLTTVDVRDVNFAEVQPWLHYDALYSPKDMLERVGLGDRVRFEVSDSVEFLERSEESYDLIFLDGDHSAAAVYGEIPLAVKRLSQDGVILLHDYFPELEPLWPEDRVGKTMNHLAVIPGPFLAVQRLMREDAGVVALPLGELPWPTKLGTNITSLALLVRGG